MNTKPSKQVIDKLEDRLAELVQAHTIADQSELNKAELERIAQNLRDTGMQVVISENEGYPHLYAHFQPVDTVEVWLSAHLDVVEGEDNQFTMTKKDGKLYGRGVYDMKFAVSVFEAVAESFADTKPPIGIIITTDEEVSGWYGSGYLSQKLSLKGKTIILPDGGGPWMIEKSAKGAVWVHLEACGIPAHGSRPHQGVNAIDLLIKAVSEIRKTLSAGSGDNPTDTTVNFGKVVGGEAVNKVPSWAHADLDIRFAPPLTLEAIKTAIVQVEAANPDVSISFGPEAHSHAADTDHDDTKLMHDIMQSCVGQEVMYVDSMGGSEARYYAAAGAHVIVFYPGGGGIHSAEEFLYEDSLVQCYNCVCQFIEKRCKFA